MIELSQSKVANRLLALMPAAGFGLLAPLLEPIDLPLGRLLIRVGEVQEHVYFPASGIASQVSGGEGSRRAEIGLYGREGAGGTAVLLWPEAAEHTHLMQVSGMGHRVGARHFAEIAIANEPLRGFLLRYLYSTFVQTAQTAHSNGTQDVGSRLARWLLMCHDRIEGDDIAITHEYIAVMLAVRRPSVTEAIHVIEGEHLVRAQRGTIRVIDRQGLEAKAEGGYGLPEEVYARAIGPMA